MIEVVEASSIPEGSARWFDNKKRAEALTLVKGIWPEFQNLMGTDKGYILRVSEPGEEWPTLDEMRKMQKGERFKFAQKTRVRIIYVIREMKRRVSQLCKSEPYWVYVGGGKVFVGWRYKRCSRKKGVIDGFEPNRSAGAA